jgi:hypothetical protein
MASLSSQVATALINLIVGVAVISLLTGVGASAWRARQALPPLAASVRGRRGDPATFPVVWS